MAHWQFTSSKGITASQQKTSRKVGSRITAHSGVKLQSNVVIIRLRQWIVRDNMALSVYLAVYRTMKDTNLSLIMSMACQRHVQNQPMQWFTGKTSVPECNFYVTICWISLL